MSLGLGGGRSVCLWRCRLLSVPLGEPASRKRWDCTSQNNVVRKCLAKNGTVEYRGTEYPEWWYQQVGRQQFCWVFKLDKYAMFSFAMTSGLASDSEKFKITITLRRARNLGATGPRENFLFCLTHNCLSCFYNSDTFFIKKRNSLSYKAQNLQRMSPGSGGGRSVRLWRCRLLSLPLGEQASGRRWDCSSLDRVVRRCFGTKW